MTEKNATCTYLINEPFAQAMNCLRKTLAAADLTISGELDFSARFRRALLVEIDPCTVLFALPSRRTVDQFPAGPCEAALTPLHVVVSGRGAQTEVHFLRAIPLLAGTAGQANLEHLQSALSQALEEIGILRLDA